MPTSVPTDALEQVFAEHRGLVHGLCYRMTGDAATADDLVQETFVRALSRPPADRSRPWAPWLVTVATRLAIDALRRRQRQAYVGPWLPGLVELPACAEPVAADGDPEARLTAARRVSYGWMLALERLSPTMRATLLLADGFGFKGPEIAAMLGLSAANVRALLHRARTRMADVDLDAAPAHAASGGAALMQLMAAAAAGDLDALQAALRDDVTLHSDGGGEYLAALRPLQGREDVARFVIGVARKGTVVAASLASLNERPWLLAVVDTTLARAARRSATSIALDRDGRVAAIWTVLATRKLHGVPFPPTPNTSR
ncbi:MAG: sigma-70 family RNA polymerase sigma factor [Nannocystaceae bacterium]|nr:sigma-70 family RNA polymerase sigma factor [Nannocystaceae bacterium]